MVDPILNSSLSDAHKVDIDKIIQDMLNNINTNITHLGINNFQKLQEEIAKLVVPILEKKLS
jgi:hypothetical protein